MKCRKHPIDHSSSIGVCATCLRQRLIAIIAAQSKAEAQEEPEEARKKPENNPPPPLLFPRSVSPYISRRKSDTASATLNHNHIKSYHSFPDPKFFSTPQIGPTGGIIVDQCYNKKKRSKFGLFSSFFRSKSDKPRVSESRESSAKSSPAWLPNFLSRKKAFSVEEPAIRHRRRDRGMSPEMNSDDENSEPSLYSSGEWKQTPKRTPAASVTRRGSGASSQLSRNVSGISFCLSPMVRANPCQNWSHKGGAPPEMSVSGELRMPIKSHSISASLCKSRSRKLADIGKCSHNR